MTATDLELTTRPMCSLLTRAAGEDPIGSVAAFDRLLVIDVPLPWPRGIRAAPRFPAVIEAALNRADARGIAYRLYGVVPDKSYTPEGLAHLIYAQRPTASAAISVYDKADFLVPHERLGELVTALLEEPEQLADFAPFRTPSTHIRDVLVCTHGTRDRCCATFGYPVYSRLRRAFRQDAAGASRAWRVSHIGGHRFAPTLLDLPSGRGWAHLDDEAISRLERTDGPLPDLRRHYRGWAALRGLPAMVAERAVFEREGWGWAARSVRAEQIRPTDPETEQTEIRLHVVGVNGDATHYDVTVEPSGIVTHSLGSCGDEHLREQRQLHVTSLVKHDRSRIGQSLAAS
jgi:hypothetical protein